MPTWPTHKRKAVERKRRKLNMRKLDQRIASFKDTTRTSKGQGH